MKQVQTEQKRKLNLKKRTIAKLNADKFAALNIFQNNNQIPTLDPWCITQSELRVCDPTLTGTDFA